MLNKMHLFLIIFFRVFAPNRPTFGFRSGLGDRQKTGFLGFRENTVFDRFRWSATLTTKIDHFGVPLFGGVFPLWPLSISILGMNIWVVARGAQKGVQKVTKKGHFLTLFWSLFGPPFGHLLDTFGRSSLMIWTKEGVQNDTKNGHFLTLFWSLFGPLLDTFRRSFLMIWPKKVVQKVTQKVSFWGYPL